MTFQPTSPVSLVGAEAELCGMEDTETAGVVGARKGIDRQVLGRWLVPGNLDHPVPTGQDRLQGCRDSGE